MNIRDQIIKGLFKSFILIIIVSSIVVIGWIYIIKDLLDNIHEVTGIKTIILNIVSGLVLFYIAAKLTKLRYFSIKIFIYISYDILYIRDPNPATRTKTFIFNEIKHAANKDNPEAQYLLGIFYFKGYGCSQDYEKFLHWIKIAYLNNEIESTETLGRLYDQGQLVGNRNISEAERLYRIGIRYGHIESIKSLTRLLIEQQRYGEIYIILVKFEKHIKKEFQNEIETLKGIIGPYGIRHIILTKDLSERKCYRQ